MDLTKNTCHGLVGKGCIHCGMDMDLEPYCVHVTVLAQRSSITGKLYLLGLDISQARPLCKGEFYEERRD